MNNFRRRISYNDSDRPLGAIALGESAPLLSVLFVNNQDPTILYLFEKDYWPSSSEWTPIGIVVCSNLHDWYGDGTSGIMSLLNMSAAHPETGALISESAGNAFVNFGKTNYSAFSNLNPTVSNFDVEYEEPDTDYYNYGPGRLEDSFYPTAYIANQSGYYSPYFLEEHHEDYRMLTSEGIEENTRYWTSIVGKSVGSTYVNGRLQQSNPDFDNMTNGFNGIRNTAYIYNATKTRTLWTSSSVSMSNSGNTPAGVCAARYKTIGTLSFLDVYSSITSVDSTYGTSSSSMPNTGFWYFPSIGELICISPLYLSILYIIGELQVNYACNACAFTFEGDKNDGEYSQYVLSSSIRDAEVITLNPYMGNVRNGNITKTNYANVVAFMRW